MRSRRRFHACRTSSRCLVMCTVGTSRFMGSSGLTPLHLGTLRLKCGRSLHPLNIRGTVFNIGIFHDGTYKITLLFRAEADTSKIKKSGEITINRLSILQSYSGIATVIFVQRLGRNSCLYLRTGHQPTVLHQRLGGLCRDFIAAEHHS